MTAAYCSAPLGKRSLRALLTAVLGAGLGVCSFLAASALLIVAGLLSLNAILFYWQYTVMLGAVVGALSGVVAGALKLRPRTAALLGGFVALGSYVVRLVPAVALGAFRGDGTDLLFHAALASVTAAAGILTGAAAGRFRVALDTQPAARWAWGLGAMFVCLVSALSLVSWARHWASAALPARKADFFAASFIAGLEQPVLDSLAYGWEPGLTRIEASRWLHLLARYLPETGQVRRVSERRRGSGITFTFEVTGARWRPDVPSRLSETPRFAVQVHRKGPTDWRVEPASLPVETYLASTYGEEAGRAWQRFLVTTPVPGRGLK